MAVGREQILQGGEQKIKNRNMLKERKLGYIGYIRSKLHKDKDYGLYRRDHTLAREKNVLERARKGRRKAKSKTHASIEIEGSRHHRLKKF